MAAFAVALVLVAAASWLVVPAGATLTDQKAQAGGPLTTGTLQPPGLPVATTVGITCIDRTSHQLIVAWTPSPSAFAGGYEILRSESLAGPFVTVGSVAGRNNTSFVDQFGDEHWRTDFVYRVRTTRNLWTSPEATSLGPTTTLRRNCR